MYRGTITGVDQTHVHARPARARAREREREREREFSSLRRAGLLLRTPHPSCGLSLRTPHPTQAVASRFAHHTQAVEYRERCLYGYQHVRFLQVAYARASREARYEHKASWHNRILATFPAVAVASWVAIIRPTLTLHRRCFSKERLHTL